MSNIPPAPSVEPYRADDPVLRERVQAALDHSRREGMWFAITTVVLTPLALLVAMAVLVVIVQTVGYQLSDDTDGSFDWFVGITMCNVVIALLLLWASRWSFRSPWVLAGMSAYAVMLGLSYGVPSIDPDGPGFLAIWAVLAIVSLTLVSQAHPEDTEMGDNVVAIIPAMILGAYRHIVQDLWFRDRGRVDLARTIAMLNAVHAKDGARQARLLAAASNRGIDLKTRLVRAKLLRTYRDELRLGDAAPAPGNGEGAGM